MKMFFLMAVGIVIGCQAFANSSVEIDRVALTEGRIGKLVRAIDLFYVDCAFYPNAFNELLHATDACKFWGPKPFVENNEAFNDAWGRPMIYTKISKTAFEIKSLGPTESDKTSPRGELVFRTK